MDVLSFLDPALDPVTEEVPAAGPVPEPADDDAVTQGAPAQPGDDQRPSDDVPGPSATVADLLGLDPPTPVEAGPRLATRAKEATKAGLATLARPQFAGVIVTGAGLFIVILLGYMYLFTALSEQRAQHNLQQALDSQVAATYDLAEGHLPAQGRPVAVLEIPTLHLTTAVVQGTDAQDLRSGPGHMPTTPMPGQPGNSVIAGRRATYGGPFGGLGGLRRGEAIRVVDGLGTYLYRVTKVTTAAAGQPDVVTPTATNRLTLVTAASAFLPSGRLVVVAHLVGPPIHGTVVPVFRADPAQLGLAGDPVDGLLALAWAFLFVVLVTATAWLLRHWDQPVVVYLLAFPVLLAVALFACESVVGFLPATL